MGRISKSKIKNAIRGSGGIITTIARSLQRSRETIYTYINKYPDIKQAVDEERERLVDMAEKNLIIKVDKGENWATSFVLRTLGKSRGYTEGIEVRGKMTTNIPTPDEVVEAYRKKLKQ